jgi:hypothetical protein
MSGAPHKTRIEAIYDRLVFYGAECSCGWKSENVHTERDEAERDAREHEFDVSKARVL